MKLVHTSLPYDRTDLEPSISKETIDYHYSELYGGYVKRFNKGEGDSDFNEAGAFLHDIYFTQFQAPSVSNKPTGSISEFINKHHQDFNKFKEEFEKVAMGIQGSGWVYLAKDGSIKTIKNHEIKKDIVVLVDWWEHAWALDYQSDKKKYLENQWKIINWNLISARIGLVESKPVGIMSLIKELKEARMLRSESDLKLTYNGACELLYLTVLTLEFLSRVKQGKSAAEKYAKTTCAYSNYTEFRSGATDLHNLIYFVQADPRRVEQIFHSDDARKSRERIHLPTMALNGWLHSVNSDSSRNVYFLMQLEQALGINTALYKEIRRLLSYNNPNDTDISNMASRILNAYRTFMPQFDLLQDLEQVLSKPVKFDLKK